MRHVDHFLRHLPVVVVIRNRLAVYAQRAVHHHTRKPELDRALAHRRRLAMILMHRDRKLRVRLDRRLDQMLQERFAGVLTRPGRSLHDDRRVDFLRGFHDGLHLFEIVHIERWHAVAIVRSVIQQLTH